jgi:hypothetical protein
MIFGETKANKKPVSHAGIDDSKQLTRSSLETWDAGYWDRKGIGSSIVARTRP